MLPKLNYMNGSQPALSLILKKPYLQQHPLLIHLFSKIQDIYQCSKVNAFPLLYTVLEHILTRKEKR